jgi:hypothetical protein
VSALLESADGRNALRVALRRDVYDAINNPTTLAQMLVTEGKRCGVLLCVHVTGNAASGASWATRHEYDIRLDTESAQGFVAGLLDVCDGDDAGALRVLRGAPCADIRPDNAGELVQLTAKELRARGIRASASKGNEGIVIERGGLPEYYYDVCCHEAWPRLCPVKLADKIQAREKQKAQEWAGDT